MIAAVSQFGSQIQPGGAFNFFGIETINDRFITLVASQTTGMQILSAMGGTNPHTGAPSYGHGSPGPKEGNAGHRERHRDRQQR